MLGLFVLCGHAAAQQQECPRIVHAEVPFYPRLALMARIQGEVVADFTVNDGIVTDAKARSGHPLLTQPTIDNIRTWRFSTDFSGKLSTTFEYRLGTDPGCNWQNPKVELHLPTAVVVTGGPIPVME